MSQSRIIRLLLSIAIVLLPTIVTLMLVRFHLDADMMQAIPTYFGPYNDSFFYWREIQTFHHVGFNGGYYTIFELPAPAQFTHFYSHGPVFPLLYGTMADLFGWYYHSAVIFNLIILTVALAFYVYKSQQTILQLVFILLMLGTFWAFLMYLPAMMQESLHYAFAIVLAYMFYVLISREEPLSPKLTLIFIGIVVFMALIRVIWAFMFIPFFLLNAKRGSITAILLAFVKAGVLILVLFGITSYLMAAFPFYYTDELIAEFKASFQTGIYTFLNHIQLNIDNFDIGFPLAIVQRYQILIFILICFGASLLLWYRRKGKQIPQFLHTLSGREITLHVFNLGIPLLFNFTIYDFFEWHDYRNLAPHLLISLLLLIYYKRFSFVALVIISNVFLFGSFLETYYEFWSPQFNFDRQSIESFGQATQDIVVYDPNAPSAWCNTLLMRMTDRGEQRAVFPPELMSLHPGIGISFYFEFYNLTGPIKSRYLLLDDASRVTFPEAHTEQIGTTPLGNIYLNLDAQCG